SICYLKDKGLHTAQIPKIALRTHRLLTKQYGQWLHKRLDSKRANELNKTHVSGTEWPLFGTVFYLWATESIQNEMLQKNVSSELLPKKYAKDTVEEAAKFLADPNQAKWVKDYWGKDYLCRENLFYRMLLISGLLSYQNILDDQKYENLLKDQVLTLAKELDESPHGLVDDYPGECYPIDIIAAIAVIKRADGVLGTDHSMFVKRAVRGFEGNKLDPNTQLPAYNADSGTGYGLGSARGIGMSFMLIWAPELWENVAIDWYAKYKSLYWQEKFGVAGFREFPKTIKNANWWMDPDSGPVVEGFGVAATAFGLGAARANNHFDDAYALGSEVAVLSWPLLDGTLLGARFLSNFTEAPYLGETALLFLFSRQPVLGGAHSIVRKTPISVHIVIFLYFLVGFFYIFREIMDFRKYLKNSKHIHLSKPFIQLFVWMVLILLGTGILIFYNGLLGLLVILFGVKFPIVEYPSRK
ncbi:MAG: hypothetical protein WCY05_06535, partial [Candidatus Omnitrophota bacterium]